MAIDVKAAATRKLGPLPAWAWGGVLGGGYLAYRLLTGKGLPGMPSIGGASAVSPTAGGGGTDSGTPTGTAALGGPSILPVMGGPVGVGSVGFDPGSPGPSPISTAPTPTPVKTISGVASTAIAPIKTIVTAKSSPAPSVQIAPISSTGPAMTAAQKAKTVAINVAADTTTRITTPFRATPAQTAAQKAKTVAANVAAERVAKPAKKTTYQTPAARTRSQAI